MDQILRRKLIDKAQKIISNDDPSHDFSHAIRVLKTAEKIAGIEGASLDIIVPSALFHDVISYPKNHPKRLLSSSESADWTKNLLEKEFSYTGVLARKVYEAIEVCSFTKGIKPTSIEAKILQDADSLEATGAVSIMRTFSSGGIMKKKFYSQEDPFCDSRSPDDMKYSLDLFYTRLLVVSKRLHTKTAKKIAERRDKFLNKFIKELKAELNESI